MPRDLLAPQEIPQPRDLLAGQDVPSPEYRAAMERMSAMTENPARGQYEALPEWQKPIVAADDTARLMAQGASFGFADKGIAALRAPFTDKSYQQELADQRSKTQAARDRSGTAGIASEISGGIAAPAALARQGVTAAGRFGTEALKGAKGLAARSGLMAAEGAGYGALTAAGNDTDIVEGALVGAGAGAGGNVVGEGLAKALSKAAGLANKKPPVLSGSDLKKMANDAYSAAERQGVMITPNGMQSLRQNVVSDLAEMGFDPDLAKGAVPALRDLDRLLDEHVTLKGLEAIRKKAAGGFKPNEKFNNQAITHVIKRIDELVQGTDPAHMVASGDPQTAAKALTEARSLWGRQAKLETVEELMEKAGLNAGSSGSGGNQENATRQQLKRLLTNKNLRRGLTPDEQEATRKAVLGTPTQNALRMAGKLSPAGNGLNMSLQAGAAGGAAYAAPEMLVPLGLLSLGGFGAKKAAEGMTSANARNLTNLIARGGNQALAAGPKNATQKLAESKRQALARALMASGITQFVGGPR